MIQRTSGAPSMSAQRTRLAGPGCHVAASMALCLMAILVSHWRPGKVTTSSVTAIAPWPAPRPARTPSQAALREARRLYLRAARRVNPELEARAEADPDREQYQEPERRRLMASEESATLGEAADAARRAMAVAQNSDERHQAALWGALIEGDRGEPREELRLAQQLVGWHPERPASWFALRRAALCNSRGDLARQADAALKALDAAARRMR